MDSGSNSTEQRNPNTKEIDQVSTLDMMKMLNDEDKLVPVAIEAELTNIARAVDIVSDAMRQGGRLVYLGAGTSGRLGVLDAAEVSSAYGVEEGRIHAFVAGGQEALTRSLSGAQDDKAMGVEELKAIGFCREDVIVGISSSGSTPYVTGALEYAKRLGSQTISLTSTRESESSQIADVTISTVVGPEAIAGSTRLKSASAHKMVLNMISTGVMIKLGKVFENLMIEVVPANYKLARRRTRIVCEACGTDETRAEHLLKEAEGDTKIAIILGLTEYSAEEARSLLKIHNNDLRKALEDTTFLSEKKIRHKPIFE